MLEALPTFLGVAQTGSFTRTAQASGQSTAAISKAIARLESELGVQLFHRTTRSVTLTEAGITLQASAERIMAEQDSVRAALSEQQSAPTGTLTVALPASLGAHGRGRYSLTRANVAFAQKYPDISMRTILSDQTTDIVREQAAVAVRISPLEDTSLKVRIISPCPMVLVAAPSYLSRAGVPVRPADLKTHRWLVYRTKDFVRHLRYAGTGGKAETIVLPDYFASNNGDQLITAVLAGLGITMLPRLFIEDDLKTGRLVQVLPDIHILPDRYLALYYPDTGVPPAKTRAYIDFMVDWFAACTAENA